MNKREACRILGVPGNCDSTDLKKRYRQLLHLVHPDGAAFRQADEEYPYGIHEIKTAYAVLTDKKETVLESPDSGTDTYARTAGFDEGYDREAEGPDAWMHRNPEYAKAVWDAEEYADAFCEREIQVKIKVQKVNSEKSRVSLNLCLFIDYLASFVFFECLCQKIHQNTHVWFSGNLVCG